MARLFITLRCLDQWIEEGRAKLADDNLTVEGVSYRLEPAVHFVSLAGSEIDLQSLLGKIKTKKQLEELAAEHYEDSVLLGEVAYQVVEGFVGEPLQ